MSEQQPATHPQVSLSADQALAPTVTLRYPPDAHGHIYHLLTPDDAVALGYALFEHGLYLKGKLKPQKEKNNEY